MAKINLPEGADPEHIREVWDLAVRLMDEHGLRPGKFCGWSFVWDSRMYRTAGYCDYENQELVFSLRLFAIWSVDDCRKTILHEIAHALTPDHGHDDVWRLKAASFGVDPRACYGLDKPEVPLKYRGTCPKGHVHYTDRLTKNALTGSCAECSPVFNKRCRFKWQRRV